jgi:hypothetical protein
VGIIKNYDTTVNDEDLTRQMLPVLKRAADGRVAEAPLASASEGFSFFAEEVRTRKMSVAVVQASSCLAYRLTIRDLFFLVAPINGSIGLTA